jgi:methyl-accepting chemotaxis protein
MSESEALSARLAFMRFDGAAEAALARARPVVMESLSGALDSFYAQALATPHTRRFFTGEVTTDDAKRRQIAHWEALSRGHFGEPYVGAVTAVGQTHARIGLEPRWYIGAYALVLDALITSVLTARWPNGLGRKAGREDTAQELAALIKVALLDMDYSISVYLEAAERARKQTEAEVLARERETVVRSIGAGLAALAEGDLTFRLAEDIPPEYSKLRDDFNGAAQRLATALADVGGASRSLKAGCEELANATDSLSRRAEQQAASLEQSAAALGEITTRVRAAAASAGQAREAAADARREVERSGEVVASAVESVTRIEESSRSIAQIIGVIDEIAFQTSLLALNAGVEAARAGDVGRGFAVVASEVRALAQRSAEAAKEIKELISASTRQVAAGVDLVHEAGVALKGIVQRVGEIDELIHAISTSATEQSTSLAEVSQAVDLMDEGVQQNAAMVEQSAAATHAMKAEAADLERLMGHFRVGTVSGDASAPHAPRRQPYVSIEGGRGSQARRG